MRLLHRLRSASNLFQLKPDLSNLLAEFLAFPNSRSNCRVEPVLRKLNGKEKLGCLAPQLAMQFGVDILCHRSKRGDKQDPSGRLHRKVMLLFDRTERSFMSTQLTHEMAPSLYMVRRSAGPPPPPPPVHGPGCHPLSCGWGVGSLFPLWCGCGVLGFRV